MALTYYLVMSALRRPARRLCRRAHQRHDGIVMLALAANAVTVLGIAVFDLGSGADWS